MKFVGLIPSRYGSSRLPGKPLIEFNGLPTFAHTYFRSSMSKLDELYLCTDDKRIYNKANELGIKTLMTSIKHKNGTERCYEASTILKLESNDVIVDIQGDEPLIKPESINKLIKNFDSSISLLYRGILLCM